MLIKAPTTFTKRRRRSSLLRRSTAGAAILVLGLGIFAISEALEVQLIRVNDLTLPLAGAEQWAEQYRRRWLATEISMVADSRVYRRARKELGGVLDLQELEAALARATDGSSAEVESVYWAPEVDHDVLLSTVFEIRETIAPTDVDENPPHDRKTLDLHGALKLLKRAIPTSTLLVPLPTRKQVLRAIEGGARPGTFSQRLAAHNSRYRKVARSWSRGYNIEQAARALDGVIIEPFGELSFNEVVGDRSFQRGFMPANEIARGRVVDGIGGGVCQVATALHAAALKAGFDIVEHYVHSKRPRYAGRGLDSAVAWGLKDLRIRNPYPDYVRVRGEAHAGELSIELWSGQKAPRVEIVTRVTEGALQSRHEKLVIERQRTVFWADGPRTDSTPLTYPAEPRD